MKPMILSEIRNFPTTIDQGANEARFHESLLRSWHIVQKVKELCLKGVPHDVLFEIIEDLEHAPTKDYCPDAIGGAFQKCTQAGTE